MAVTPDHPQNTPNEQARIAQEVSDAATLELIADTPELVAFSSQLVHGSVGLNSAGVIYRDYGIRVAQIPTILLSVLPHYASVHHVDIPTDWLTHTLHDLYAAQALNDVRGIVTGYLAHHNQAESIAQALRVIPQLQSVPLIVDPTLGDTDVGFYTNPALVDGIRKWLLPLATGLVPNLFELSHLAEVPIELLTSLTSIEDAARNLISDSTAWIVVTGIRLSATSEIHVLLVTHDSAEIFTHEYIEHHAKGVGDTYTALLLAQLLAGNQINTAIPLSNAAILQRLHSSTQSSKRDAVC